MGWQKDNIKDMADELGIDSGGPGSSQLEQMQKIAKEVGMDSFNGLSNADTDELERRLRQRKNEQATLPNGEKLSDKIQKNKIIQGLNNKNNANKKDEDKKDKNKKSENENSGNKKNKPGDYDKESSREMARAAAKLAADSYPAISWVPKKLRDKIIDKIMDSGVVDNVLEIAAKRAKVIKTVAIIGAIIPIMMWLFLIAILVWLILSPLAFLLELLGNVLNFIISFGSFLLGFGWCVPGENCNEDLSNYYYNRLNVEAQAYEEKCDTQLNRELITATIFYDRMTSKNPGDVGGGQFDSVNIDQNAYYKYSQSDADHIIDLVNVYKNDNYKATCPTVADKMEQLSDDVIALMDGKFTADDIDNIIMTRYNYIPTVADLIEWFGDLKSGKVSLWAEIVTAAKGDFSCFKAVMERIKDNLGSDDSTCSFDKDNYREYLKDYYIPDNYNYLISNEEYGMSKDDIVDEIFQMAKEASGGEDSGTVNGQVIAGFGEAGPIPDFILKNSGSPLGKHQGINQTSCFGYYSIENCQPHTGIDIGKYAGKTKIYSIADGEVVEIIRYDSNCYPDFSKTPKCGGCPETRGNTVGIKHTVEVDGVVHTYYSEYMHLDSISVSKGQKIYKGAEIGIMGNTGCSTGTHLHFNMYDSNKKRYNPEELLVHLGEPVKFMCDMARRVCSK